MCVFGITRLTLPRVFFGGGGWFLWTLVPADLGPWTFDPPKRGGWPRALFFPATSKSGGGLTLAVVGLTLACARALTLTLRLS